MIAGPAVASLAAAMLVVLAPAPGSAGPPAHAKAEAPSTEELLARIQSLGRDLQHWLRVAHDMSMAGESIEPLRPELQELERRFEELKRDLALVEPDDIVNSKARMVELLLWNLRHAMELGDARDALPRGAAQPFPSQLGAVLLDAGPPPNDDCTDAIAITFGTVTGSTAEATNDGVASCGSSVYSPDVWYRFTAPEDGKISVDTLGSSYDTVLSAYASCPGVPSSELACNDDASGLQSRIMLSVATGEEYLIRISGFDQASGDFVLNVFRAGGITGTVSEASTGVPIPSALVSAYDQSGYRVARDYTNSSGEYELVGLDPGEYRLLADALYTYIDEVYDDIPCPRGSYYCDTSVGTPVAVTVGSTTSHIDFLLDRASVVSGHVRDLDTGDPVSSAAVVLYDAAGAWMNDDYTDVNGVYSIGGLSAATYFVLAKHSDYFDELYDDLPCEGGAPSGCDPTTGTAVLVPPGDTVGDIDFELQTFGAVSGTVTDEVSGEPLRYVDVSIKRADGTTASYSSTHEDGGYRAGGLVTGTYFAVASHSAYLGELYDDTPCSDGCDAQTGSPISVTNGLVTSGIDIALTPRARFTGRLTRESTGDPVSGYVDIYDATGWYVEDAYADSSGIYSSGPLDPGTYFAVTDISSCEDELYDNIPCEYGCDVLAGTGITVADGPPTTGVDFSLTSFGKIAGTVTDASSGAGLGSVRVEVWRTTGLATYTDSNAAGEFALAGLRPGTYFVATDEGAPYVDKLYDGIECPGGPPDGCSPASSGTPITIGLESVVTGVDLALDVGGSISGTVVDALSASPLSSVTIDLYDAAGQHLGSRSSSSTGAYEFAGLAAGQYHAVASKDATHLPELFQGLPCAETCDPTTGTPINVALGAVTAGIDFSLTPFGGIAGHVRTDPDGRPVESVSVYLYHQDGTYVWKRQSDSQGAYRFDYVATGRYFLRANGAYVVGELYDGIPCDDGCDPTAGTPVDVEAAATTDGIDFRLSRRGTITGSVVAAATGHPLENLTVYVYEGDGSLVALGRSKSTGVYTVQGLNPGTYFAKVDNYLFTPQLYDGVPCAWDCEITTGTPVIVELGGTTTSIDFELVGRGSIEGTLRDAMTGSPLSGKYVKVWNEADKYCTSTQTDGAGHYVFSNLPSGTYFVVTDLGSIYPSAAYLDELFRDIPCLGGAPSGCDPIKGEPVVVGPGVTVSGIDFDLTYFGDAITGVVTDGSSGAPVGGVRIDVWDAVTTELVSSVVTSATGTYLATLPNAGQYLVSTDTASDYFDEVYNNVPCPEGSALAGLCDPTSGEAVTVEPGAVTAGISFSLVPSGTEELFEDGFESGDEGGWASRSGGGLRVEEDWAHTGSFGLRIAVDPDTCSADTTVHLGAETISSLVTVDACASISTGGGFIVAEGGRAALTAGIEIALGNGTSVERGGSLMAAIAPLMSPYSFLRDDSPSSERSYHAEFFVNLDELSFEVDIFEALSDSGDVVLRVRANPRLSLYAWDSSGTERWTATIPVRKGWNRVVVGWYAGTEGRAWMVVNEGPVVDVTAPAGFDTSSLEIDKVRLGILPTSTGYASGAIALDDFSSWR